MNSVNRLGRPKAKVDATRRRGIVLTHVSVTAFGLIVLVCGVGCEKRGTGFEEVSATAFEVRAARRAFDGAPPVIPHKPFGSACDRCHTKTGSEVPGSGFAPANPHQGAANEGSLENCRQCHVFAFQQETFAGNSFEGLRQTVRRGERLYAGAPPTTPHHYFMRENCAACHSGDAGRREIRCTHPERSNCVQCHTVAKDLNGVTDEQFAAGDSN